MKSPQKTAEIFILTLQKMWRCDIINLNRHFDPFIINLKTHKDLISLKWKEISFFKNSLNSPEFPHVTMEQCSLTEQYQPADH